MDTEHLGWGDGDRAHDLVLLIAADGAATPSGVGDARLERSAGVDAAVAAAGRAQPELVVLHVPLDDVARGDALRRLQTAAPRARLVVLPVRAASGPPDLDVLPHAEASQTGARVLEPLPASAAAARRLVRATCSGVEASDLCFDALLVTTEMVTNAVTHARTPVWVTVRAWPTVVRIEVGDGAAERPVARQPDTTASGGRGIALMDALCSAWGVDPAGEGKTVWAQLASPGPLPVAG